MQIFITRILIGGSRSLALIGGLILSLVHWGFTSNFIMGFPVAYINRLSEHMEVSKVVRFTLEISSFIQDGNPL